MGRRVHFLANCCQTCKKLHPTYACEICHMVFYCSEKDRRENWFAHSQLCRALFKLSKARGVARIYENAAMGSGEAFRNLRHSVAMECTEFLGRTLEAWELEVLYWPKVCNVCFKQTDDLVGCDDCDFVFTCTEKHFKENHRKWCSTLKLYQEIARFVEKDGIPFLTDFKLEVVDGKMAEIVAEFSKSSVENAFLSEHLTYPLTVYHTAKNLPKETTFIIHIIGAEIQAEVLPLSKWENYFLHQLPEACRVDLKFIGPNLQPHDEMDLKSDIDLCQCCRNLGKKLSYELVCNTVYHAYMQSPTATKPHLITALNAGLYRLIGFQGTDTWTPTLSEIFQQSAPVLITEYTFCEISKDKDLILKKFPNAKMIHAPDENPFASIRPSLNVISDEETPVIFKNYFFMVFKVPT